MKYEKGAGIHIKLTKNFLQATNLNQYARSLVSSFFYFVILDETPLHCKH